jgi:hypothetical protein
MSGDRAMWTIASILYGMLVIMIVALWRMDWTIGGAGAMFLTFYVGAGFGVFNGYILAHVLRRGLL